MSADSQQQQQHRNQTTPPLPQEQSGYGALSSIITSVLAKKMPKKSFKKKIADISSQILPDQVLAQHLKYLLTHQQYSPARQTFLFFNCKIKY